MKLFKVSGLAAGIIALGFVSFASTSLISSIEDYNKQLPFWGVSWSPGAQSVNGYYPSFYTGFVMRSESPERIHIRVSRGNQTRVSVILDDQTITDYTFDLAKRYSFYKKMTDGSRAPLNIKPSGASFLPQLSFFNQIIESSTYDILGFVERANQGSESSESIYAKNLNTLRALNPGRVFILNLDLYKEFSKWKTQVQKVASGNVNSITKSPQETIAAINNLLFGRINYTAKPSSEILTKLNVALSAAVENKSEAEFNQAALSLFKALTGTKYDFKVVNSNGQWQKALQCTSESCILSYPEFTAIYPTGSVMETTSDEFGNRINSFATPGLWNFLSRSGRHDVDNIRNEPYYGFIPKMDYQGIGNGFHNPAVRFWNPSKAIKESLNISKSHETLWAVKRGGVSHGCLRLPVGSVWELRHILPVENDKMTKVSFFGSRPQDFDVFDIDGSGQLKVMGVEYFISYGLAGTSDTARREGSNLEINGNKKLEFYTTLYGANNIFEIDSNNNFIFKNPRISMPSYLDQQKASVSTKFTVEGQYPLYEQSYEQDKVQFYALGEMTPERKLLTRLMGRTRGCAPTSDKKQCGEAAFEAEMKTMVRP